MNNEDVMYYLTKRQKSYMVFKRIFDFIFALICLIILSLPLCIVFLITKLNNMRHKAIFTQNRVGKNGKLFKIYKFRTLSNISAYIAASDVDFNAHSNKWGRFLRKTSLDELPQLINVLKGDMSLIGPRPLILNEKNVHTLRNKKGVYQISPGITGLAQVKGRNSISNESKVEMDYEYLKSYGFIIDIKVFFLSIVKVLGRKNI